MVGGRVLVQTSYWANTIIVFGEVFRIVAQGRGFVNLSRIGFGHYSLWIRPFFDGDTTKWHGRHGHFGVVSSVSLPGTSC